MVVPRAQRAISRDSFARLTAIVRDTGWVGAGEVLTLVSGLVTLAVLIKGLGPADYGRFVGLQAFAATMSTLSSAWVILLMLQHSYQGGRPLRQTFGRALGLAVPAGMLALVAGWALRPVLLPSIPAGILVAYLAAELLGGVLVQVSAAAVQVARGLPAATRVRMLLTATRVTVVVGLALTGRADLQSIAFGLLGAYGFLGLVVHLTTTRRLSLGVLPLRPRLRNIREGMPYAGALASLAVQEDSDKIIMLRFADPIDTGIYAAAYRLVQLGGIPLRALLGSSHPRFLVDTPGERREHLRRTLRYTLPTTAYGLVAVLVTVLFAPYVPRLLGPQYNGTEGMIMVLAPLVLLRTASLFPMNALLGLRRYTLRFFVIFSTTVLNVTLNLTLIPPYSWRGAVGATIITEVVFILLVWFCVVRAQRQHDAAQDRALETQPTSLSEPVPD